MSKVVVFFNILKNFVGKILLTISELFELLAALLPTVSIHILIYT